MNDEAVRVFIDLLEQEKQLKSSSYTKKDGAEIQGKELETTIKKYFYLLEPDVQRSYEQDLIDGKSSDVNKFIKNVNRSLNGVKTSSVEEQLENFKNVELATYSKRTSIFLEEGFARTLELANREMKEKLNDHIGPFVGNITTQLNGVTPDREGAEKEALFNVTAYLISGLVTNKQGHSRTVDNTMTNRFGQIPDEKLVSEVAKYADSHLSELSSLDVKVLKFIGSALKESYNSLPEGKKSKEDIARAFNDVDVESQKQVFQVQRQARGVLGGLSGVFRGRSASDPALLKIDNKTQTKNDRKVKTI